jgi:hypothetical protein
LARGECLERLRPKAAERLATVAPRIDEARRAEPADVPADEGLRQADVLDELGHARVAAREALHDAEPIDVGESLVNEAELAELLRLVDDGCDGRPDPGAGRADLGPPSGDGSTALYINSR